MIRFFALATLGILSPAETLADSQLWAHGDITIQDADTFQLGSLTVRLEGIDAPETGQTCRKTDGTEWLCGKAALRRLAQLIEGQDVECVAVQQDPYGRVVSKCYVDGIDVSETLIVEGHAWAFVEYSDSYVAQELKAKENGIGIWSGEAQAPWDYRDDKWARAVAASPNGCPIKGNINRDGEKIYHTPWAPNYAQTKINERYGERWFCNEADASAEGWRASRSR